ncbi:MAG: DUF1415 domain-containing protein, partial [Eudoraea sp.]|nr:DUF1415 domain-containing protein [Eudoraea sp.]
ANEFQLLTDDTNIETTLFILPQGFDDFENFLDLIDLTNQLIDELGYRSTYQVAHFHPDYCFEGEKENDPANFTNRAPYPTLHLLREASLQKAIESYPDTSAIPDNNIKLARKLGFDKMQALLNNCIK